MKFDSLNIIFVAAVLNSCVLQLIIGMDTLAKANSILNNSTIPQAYKVRIVN